MSDFEPATYTEDVQCARCREEGAIEFLDESGIYQLEEPIEIERVCSTIGIGLFVHPVVDDDE